MPKRTIDTSRMFMDMTGRDAPVNLGSPLVEEPADAAKKTNNQSETKRTNAPEEIKSDRKDQPSESNKVKANKEAKSKSKAKSTEKPSKKDKDPRDCQSVKLGFYLTPRVRDALSLYKAENFIGSHNDSQIINAALTEYLAKEMAAVKAVEAISTEDNLLRKAMEYLHSNAV